MISYEYSKETSYKYRADGGVDTDPVCTVMLTGADFLAKAPMNQHNGARAYIIDWKELDDSTQSSIGSQVLIFDKSGKRWCKQ